MSNKIQITVSEHSWLDCSVTWFVNINGEKSGGEIYTKSEAIDLAKRLAKQLDGKYVGINETNELFS